MDDESERRGRECQAAVSAVQAIRVPVACKKNMIADLPGVFLR